MAPEEKIRIYSELVRRRTGDPGLAAFIAIVGELVAAERFAAALEVLATIAAYRFDVARTVLHLAAPPSSSAAASS